MSKDAYYFPHDSNARNDVKILHLRRVHGNEGYGIFWMLVEVLREQNEFKLPLSSIKELAFDFRISEEILFSIIKNFKLFEIENNEFFYSQSLINRLQPYLEKSKRARNAARIRWINQRALNQDNINQDDANAMQMHSENHSNAMQQQCSGNASKVKKSKVKKSKEKYNNEKNIIKVFDFFISCFDNKYLKDKDIIYDIIDKVIRIDKHQPEEIIKYIKHIRCQDHWFKPNFNTPRKLRQKNKEGMLYIDYFKQLWLKEAKKTDFLKDIETPKNGDQLYFTICKKFHSLLLNLRANRDNKILNEASYDLWIDSTKGILDIDNRKKDELAMILIFYDKNPNHYYVTSTYSMDYIRKNFDKIAEHAITWIKQSKQENY